MVESRPLLRAITGPLAGGRFPIVERLVIGRGDDVDISLPDDTVSREHAVISVGPGGAVSISDLSRNGTFVGGVAIKDDDLIPGCTIRIGQTQFVFELVSPEEAERNDQASASGSRSDRERPTDVDMEAVARKTAPQGHGKAYKTTQAVRSDDIPGEAD